MVFRSDPCGIVCLIITYVCIFYADYVVIRWIIMETMATSYVQFLFLNLVSSSFFTKKKRFCNGCGSLEITLIYERLKTGQHWLQFSGRIQKICPVFWPASTQKVFVKRNICVDCF